MGVKTIQLTEARGKLVGARVVRDGYQVMLISTGGTVIKMPVEDVKRLGRSTQGVIVMRLREGELVSTLAPVVDSSDDDDRRADADGRRRDGRRRTSRRREPTPESRANSRRLADGPSLSRSDGVIVHESARRPIGGGRADGLHEAG